MCGELPQYNSHSSCPEIRWRLIVSRLKAPQKEFKRNGRIAVYTEYIYLFIYFSSFSFFCSDVGQRIAL